MSQDENHYKIIQFTHPGPEATPNHQDLVEWNNTPTHRRKFIKSKGKYISNIGKNDETETKGELVFWGEWEAQSKAKKLISDKPPHYLHTPYLDISVTERTHNTDPNVFGNNFRYIICRQQKLQFLKTLKPLSLILFGSCINEKFHLDTLFVVSNETIKYSLENIKSKFNKGSYYYASVEPIFGDTKCNPNVEEESTCRINDNETFTFYEGVNYNNRKDYNHIYSFSPCKLYNTDNEAKYVFERPVIDLDIITPNLAMGAKGKDKNFSSSDVVKYWNKIVEQVTEKGLLLGTHFETPTIKQR